MRGRKFPTIKETREIRGGVDAARESCISVRKVSAHHRVHASRDLLSGQRGEGGGEKVEKKILRFSRGRESAGLKMALMPRCRGGGGENLPEELANEDEGANGGNFEPLSDSCGESDMEGLDLSLFEPQVDAASWCDSRIHAGTLHILVHYCGKMCLHDIYVYIYVYPPLRLPSEISPGFWSKRL